MVNLSFETLAGADPSLGACEKFRLFAGVDRISLEESLFLVRTLKTQLYTIGKGTGFLDQWLYLRENADIFGRHLVTTYLGLFPMGKLFQKETGPTIEASNWEVVSILCEYVRLQTVISLIYEVEGGIIDTHIQEELMLKLSGEYTPFCGLRFLDILPEESTVVRLLEESAVLDKYAIISEAAEIIEGLSDFYELKGLQNIVIDAGGLLRDNIIEKLKNNGLMISVK